MHESKTDIAGCWKVLALIAAVTVSALLSEAGPTNVPPFRVSALFRRADKLAIGLTDPKTGWNAIIPVGASKAGISVLSCNFETETVRISQAGKVYDLKLKAGKKLRAAQADRDDFAARIAKGEITVVPIEITSTNWVDISESSGALFDALVRETATNPPPDFFSIAVEDAEQRALTAATNDAPPRIPQPSSPPAPGGIIIEMDDANAPSSWKQE
jgi:hypothetical protein